MPYTKKQVDEANRFLSESMVRTIEQMVRQPSLYEQFGVTRKPFTRREVIDYRLRMYRGRIREAIDVLRGTHDCY